MKALSIIAIIVAVATLIDSKIEEQRLRSKIEALETKLAWEVALARGAATDEVRILREEVRAAE